MDNIWWMDLALPNSRTVGAGAKNSSLTALCPRDVVIAAQMDWDMAGLSEAHWHRPLSYACGAKGLLARGSNRNTSHFISHSMKLESSQKGKKSLWYLAKFPSIWLSNWMMSSLEKEETSKKQMGEDRYCSPTLCRHIPTAARCCELWKSHTNLLSSHWFYYSSGITAHPCV